MKQILILISMLVVISGCTNSGNKDANTQAGVPAVTPQGGTPIYGDHNPSACPVNLVGTYQLINGRMGRGSIEMLHISTQQNGVLVITQQARGSAHVNSLAIADGVRRAIDNGMISDYQITYCQNQTIVTTGVNRGLQFQQVIYGSRQGIEVSASSNRERPLVLSYRRNGM